MMVLKFLLRFWAVDVVMDVCSGSNCISDGARQSMGLPLLNSVPPFQRLGYDPWMAALIKIEPIRQRRDERLRDDFAEFLLECSIDGMLAFDTSCCYTIWNSAMERIS